MKTLLFLILAGYAVDDSHNFVVEMPDNDVLPTKDFKVYWNVPTKQCKSKKIFFDDLYEKYGILQNTGDTFLGDKISIIYDNNHKVFPELLRNSSSGEIMYRNGGVPQEGDLIKHLDTFQKVLEQSVPDKNFNGLGIIDFESWRPVLRQNFNAQTPYKDVSYEIEKKRHWWWEKQWIEEEAKRRFEGAGREFMQATVSLAKYLRPYAVWGYYGFPYCFNMANKKNGKEACADRVTQENDGISWLWQESTALYPSVYSSDDINADQLASLIRGRVREAARVANSGAPILPYFWYRYRNRGFFSESDLNVALSTFYKSNASGFIIWGSSDDVNTIEKCKNLKQYVTDTLGPAVAKYTKRNMSKSGSESGVVLVTEEPFKKNLNETVAVTVPTATEEHKYYYMSNTTDNTAGENYETHNYVDISTLSTSDKINEISSTFYISKEPNFSKQETTTVAIATTKAEENNNRLIIQKINSVVLSIEESNSTDESSTKYSTPTLSTTKKEPIKSTTRSPEGTIDNRTSVGNESDSSTTLAPVFTEQVVVSVVYVFCDY